MAAFFQTALMRLALCGLATSLLVLVLRSRMARDTFARLLSIWRSLTAFGRVAVCSFLLVGVLVGGDKTNGVNNLPPQMMSPMAQQGHGFLLTGLWVNGNLANVMNLVQSQTTFAERKTANWNIRGAWKDSLWLDFEDDFVFPWGTNHLTGVEVVSYGQVWATPFDTNAVASAGAPFEIVPGLTTFAYEFTPSNSCRFAWAAAAINRDTNNLVSAVREFFRNGDVSVTTNGVAALLPRMLPFPHSGFGQDDEWVTANFTNATEILAVGYPQWVDSQVGDGLTNGLYKLSVAVADDPPETTLLSVGNLSVAVTNAGEYVFLLEKGPAYGLTVFPPSSNVTISAVDDVPTMRGTPLLRSFGDADGGQWVPDSGNFWTDYAAGMGYARLWWLPWLCGSPNVNHIGPDENSITFSAVLYDCRQTNDVTYSWSASAGLDVASPNSQTTEISVSEMPSWAEASIYVTATFGTDALTSYTDGLTYGTNETPQVHLSLDVPVAILLNSNELSTAKIAAAGWSFSSDAPTSGTVRVTCLSGSEKVVAPGIVGEWAVYDDFSVSATVEGVGTSAAVGDVVFRMEFWGGSTTNTVEKALTVVRTGNVLIPSAPVDGLVVLTNTPVAMHVECEPQGAGAFLSTIWHTRRLKSDGEYDGWQLATYGQQGASFVFTPTLGGIYQIRSLASVAAGGVDERSYIWLDDNDDMYGPCTNGQIKTFGVANEQWQIDLRNSAKEFIGQTNYSRRGVVPSQFGFDSIPRDTWKCNIFVAHSIVRAGLTVPHNTTWLRRRTYPPKANDWAGDVIIQNWIRISAGTYIQPGFVVAHPDHTRPDSLGHCGIVDFDGNAIAAGRHNVNRMYEEWLDGTSGFRRYEENENNN